MALGAVGAYAGKDQIMAFHLVAAEDNGLLIQVPVVIHALQIVDRAADAAAEMGMGLGIGVVPLDGEGHPDDDPLLRQQIEVPVYRPQAQAGILRLELLIEHLRRGVLPGGQQALVDQLPLFGITLSCHDSLPRYQ